MRFQFDPASIDRYTLDDYFTSIYRRKWIIVVMTVCTVSFAVVASKLITPRFEAKTVFYVPDDTHTTEKGAPPVSEARLPSGVIEQAKAYIGILQGKDAAVAINRLFPQKSKEDLQRDVDFSATRGGLVEVYARDRDPKLAADIANAYFTYFNDFHQQMAEGSTHESLDKIQERLQGVNAQLNEAREKKRSYLQEHNIASLSTAVDEYERQRATCRENLQHAGSDLKDAEQRIASLNTQLESESRGYEAGTISAPSLSILSETLTNLELELASKTSRLGANHPDVLETMERYNRAKQLYENETRTAALNGAKPSDSTYEFLRRSIAQAEADRDGAAGRQKELTARLASLDAAIAALPATELAVQTFDDEIQQFASAKSELEEARNTIDQPTLHLRKTALAVETAYPPNSPIFPIMWLNVATATIMGLALGILYSLFLEHLEARRRLNRMLPFAGLHVQLHPMVS